MTIQNIQNGNVDAVGNDKLHKQFNNLEQAWDSFKRTKSQCRGRKHCNRTMDNDVKVPEDEVQLGHFDYSSPSSLQQNQNPKQSGSSEEEEEWNVRTNDLAVLEMLSERKDCMRSGKIKSRSLHDALESASKMGKREENEELHIQSGCSSSVLIQKSGVKRRLFTSRSSLDCDDDNVSGDDYCKCYSFSGDDYCNCSSLSSPLSSVEKNGKAEQVVNKKKEQVGGGEWNSDGGKWMALMGWVAILLMVFALGIITWKSYDCYSPSLEYDDFFYPT